MVVTTSCRRGRLNTKILGGLENHLASTLDTMERTAHGAVRPPPAPPRHCPSGVLNSQLSCHRAQAALFFFSFFWPWENVVVCTRRTGIFETNNQLQRPERAASTI